jgi:hypothetical protein
LNAGSVVILTFVLVKQLTPDDVQNARQKSLPQPGPSFIIVNFPSTRLFISLIMYAKRKRIFLHMSSPGVYLSGR